MTQDRVRALMDVLPKGLSEWYFHPESERDAVLRRLMLDYEHEAQLDAVLQRDLIP